MMLLVLTITLCASVCLSQNTRNSPRRDGVSFLLNTIRKQLMKDNHDYPLQNNETQNIQMRTDTKEDERKHDKNKTLSFTEIGENHRVSLRSKYITDRAGGSSRREADESNVSYEKSSTVKKPLENPVEAKDLLYYMDEERLLKDRLGPETRDFTTSGAAGNGTDKKYMIVEMRDQYRRREPRRFIHEEGKERVVVMSLDEGPLPEFRLPYSRRQYKHERGLEVNEDGELPPPAVRSDDGSNE